MKAAEGPDREQSGVRAPDAPERGKQGPASTNGHGPARHAPVLGSIRSVQRLQGRAGNGAIAKLAQARAKAPATKTAPPKQGAEGGVTGGALLPFAHAGPTTETIQRKSAGGGYEPPAPPPPPNPNGDPKFNKLKSDVKKTTKDVKKHPAPATEAKKASDAAVAPGDDKEGQAKAAKAEKMAGAKKGSFDKEAFINAVMSAAEQAAPKTLEDADKGVKADGVTAQVTQKVKDGKDASAKDTEEKAKEPPDPSTAVEKPVTPLQQEQTPKPKTPDFAAGMPSKQPEETKNFDGAKNEVEDKMKAADVSEKDMEKANEPQASAAVDAKKEGDKHTEEAPKRIEQKEEEQIAKAKGDAKKVGTSGLEQMHASKVQGVSKVASKKVDQKSKDEAKRREVSAKLNTIFDTTKADVDQILTDLDKKVEDAWTKGEKEARDDFTRFHKGEFQKWKDKRSWTDAFFDLFRDINKEPEVAAIWPKALDRFKGKMRTVISGIADLVGAELDRAKARVERGKQEMQTYIKSLPKDVQKFATDAAKDMQDKFDQLEKDVDEKGSSVASDLGEKYKASLNEVNEEIKKEQESHKGLWEKAKGLVGDAIEMYQKLKAMFTGLLAKAIGAFKKIIADPLTFIGNFMNAVKQGFMNFAGNIVTHLKNGLKGWLFGQLAAAGIEIPETFDLKGIIKMVLSILGLTWANIRPRIVKVIGEPAMKVLETTAEVFVILVKEGPAGLIKWLQDKLSDLKDMVIDQIKSFVIERIVKAGITWVLGMLNPAGALIKIVQALIAVVQWIMERGAQLMGLINTVVDAINDIANGGGGGVPAKIEKALADAVPLVISFLAGLLGLGGISEKIKSILQAVQKPVMKAVDAVIMGAVKAAKKLLMKLKTKAKKAKDKILGLFKPVAKPVSMGGASHTVHVTAGPPVKVEMASSRGAILAQIQQGISEMEAAENGEDPSKKPQPGQVAALKGIVPLASKVIQISDKAAKEGVEDLTGYPGFGGALEALNKAIGDYGNKYKQKSFRFEAKDDSDAEIKKLVEKYGMPYENFKALQKVAKKFNVVFDVRSTTTAAISLLRGGKHKPKPEMIKAKTVNMEDTFLGPFTKDNIGEVGFFNPKLPPGGAPKKDAEGKDVDPMAVMARYTQRQQEYSADQAYMKGLVDEGKITIANGLVKDKTSGKGFTGDHDLFQIWDNPPPKELEDRFGGLTGPNAAKAAKQADELKKSIVGACKVGGVEHGAHMDWKKKIGDDPRKNSIFMAIVSQHQGGNALLRIRPDGPPGPAG